MLAASAICLARVTLGVQPYWTPELQVASHPHTAPHLHTFHITPSHPQAAALSTYDASYYSLLTASYLPLQAFSAYDASAVRACIVELHSLHRKAASATLRAVFDKYATPDVLAVSSLTPPETLPLVLDNSA